MVKLLKLALLYLRVSREVLGRLDRSVGSKGEESSKGLYLVAHWPNPSHSCVQGPLILLIEQRL